MYSFYEIAHALEFTFGANHFKKIISGKVSRRCGPIAQNVLTVLINTKILYRNPGPLNITKPLWTDWNGLVNLNVNYIN